MTGKTVDAILHDIFTVGISAAAIFVKNPNSQQHAASIIQLLQTSVLPVADSLLTLPAAPASSAAPVAKPAQETTPILDAPAPTQ